ncbi:hypothetical protein [Clostridium psychrophilum]|uniref:hypothetical protein n=1 Tax=Clostridium psychrophilum TaxID=132926 RepID=UPI001FEC779A|nr:hypothetical protein [Clostridium psychrophilum]
MKYCDVVIGSMEEAELAEGKGAECNDLLKELVENFYIKYASIILRERFAPEDVDWTAVLYDGVNFIIQKNMIFM